MSLSLYTHNNTDTQKEKLSINTLLTLTGASSQLTNAIVTLQYNANVYKHHHSIIVWLPFPLYVTP